QVREAVGRGLVLPPGQQPDRIGMAVPEMVAEVAVGGLQLAPQGRPAEPGLEQGEEATELVGAVGEDEAFDSLGHRSLNQRSTSSTSRRRRPASRRNGGRTRSARSTLTRLRTGFLATSRRRMATAT